MIDYSCNYTSWESNGPMSGVKIHTFRPNPGPSSVNYDLEYKAGRLYTCKRWGKKELLLVAMMVVPHKVMCDNEQACMCYPGGLHLFSTSPHPPLDFGAPKGSHTPTTVGRCGASNPVRQRQKGVHRTNREDIGPLSKGTQKGPDLRECPAVGSSRTRLK